MRRVVSDQPNQWLCLNKITIEKSRGKHTTKNSPIINGYSKYQYPRKSLCILGLTLRLLRGICNSRHLTIIRLLLARLYEATAGSGVRLFGINLSSGKERLERQVLPDRPLATNKNSFRNFRRIRPDVGQEQCSFVKETGTKNTIFVLQMAVEIIKEMQNDKFPIFIDYVKPFTKVRHQEVLELAVKGNKIKK